MMLTTATAPIQVPHMPAYWQISLVHAAVFSLALLTCGCSDDEAASRRDASLTDTADTSTAVEWAEGEPCQPLVGTRCFSAWPGDFWTRPDAASPTGRRMAIPQGVLPVNAGGTRIDPAAWNLRDGASPVLPIVLLPPEPLDPQTLPDEANTDRSLQENSPTLLVNLATGERVRHMSELDQNAQSDADRALIVRPWSPLQPGARYAFALTTHTKTKSGKALVATNAMQLLLQGEPTGHPRIDSDLTAWLEARDKLAARAGGATNLVAFWPITIASVQWTTQPAVQRAADLTQRLQSWTPAVTISQIEVDTDFVDDFPNLGTDSAIKVAPMHQDLALRIRGTFQTPWYLTSADPEGVLDWQTPFANAPLVARPFVVLVPRSAVGKAPAQWFWYGHGFLRGGCIEGCIGPQDAEFFPHLAQGLGRVAVAGDWYGLSQGEAGIAFQVSSDLSAAPKLTDKLVQGAVQTQAMTAAFVRVIAKDPRFAHKSAAGTLQDLAAASQPVQYYGNSLGGIMGTTSVALHPEVDRAVFNVPGAVWSTMMNRSSNFNAFLEVIKGTYPDAFDQQLGWALLQPHWDLSDPIHFAPLVLQPPARNPARKRQALWLQSEGDSQVPNLTTGMLQRAAGVPWLGPPAGPLAPDTQTLPAEPFSGAGAFVAWDSNRGSHPAGNALPFPDNGAHLATRWMIEFKWQVQRFLQDGVIEPRYCLPPQGRDADGQLPCKLEQAIPAKAAELPDFASPPPAL